MNPTTRAAGNRRAATLLEALSLAAVALLALELAVAFPVSPHEATPPERDYVLYFQAQQLFHCNPEELSEARQADLKRWCQCMPLTTRHNLAGIDSLTDEDCRFVVEVLDELCPETEAFAGFHRIRESCRQSVYCRQATIAADRKYSGLNER